MDRKKIIYIGIILIITVIVSITYFSYAFFTKKDEYHGRLNIVAGQLKYRIESTDLENNSITLPANTSKRIIVEIESLNTVDSNYKLYYDNSNVEVGYKADTEDMPSGSISNSGKKKVTLVVRNNTSASQTVTFGVKGGFSGKEVVLNDEHSIDNPASTCSYADGYVWNFDYTGNIQTFTVPCEGNYQLEVWGAQGGSYSSSCIGGYGGYSIGDTSLIKDNSLYVVVGGAGSGNGQHGYRAGGYNGGGNATADGDGNTRQASGGGATHIGLKTGLLSSFNNERNKLLVAAGGGGGGSGNVRVMCVNGGAGGGINGNNGQTFYEATNYYGIGGSQTAGGTYAGSLNANYIGRGSFGTGASSYTAGGGGGYFGGGVAAYSAGGGSGYIGNTILTNKHMTCYNCTTSDDISTKTISNTCVNDIATADCSKTGNGYARITYLGD